MKKGDTQLFYFKAKDRIDEIGCAITYLNALQFAEDKMRMMIDMTTKGWELKRKANKQKKDIQ